MHLQIVSLHLQPIKLISHCAAETHAASSRETPSTLKLHTLAYNLGNFMRTLALPEAVKHWSLTSLKEKLIKIGARIVTHGRYVTFQMAEVAVPRGLFAEILRLIAEMRPRSAPA